MKNGFVIKGSFLLLCAIDLWSMMPNRAEAQDWKTWHYYADFSRLLSTGNLDAQAAGFNPNAKIWSAQTCERIRWEIARAIMQLQYC